MNNCLVTKLKATVENSSLIKINETTFSVNTSVPVLLAFGSSTTFRPLSGSMTVVDERNNSYTEETDGINMRTIVGQGSFASDYTRIKDFRIGNLTILNSNLFKILAQNNLFSIEMQRCNYAADFVDFTGGIVKTNCINIEIQNCPNININIGSISNSGKFPNVKYFQCYKTHVTGNIEDLAEFNDLSVFDLVGASLNEGHNSIEGLVQAFRAKGKTTSTGDGLRVRNNVPQDTVPSITFGGNPVLNKGYITWTASTITFNGVTVNA